VRLDEKASGVEGTARVSLLLVNMATRERANQGPDGERDKVVWNEGDGMARERGLGKKLHGSCREKDTMPLRSE
jgi:hypothetical protein